MAHTVKIIGVDGEVVEREMTPEEISANEASRPVTLLVDVQAAALRQIDAARDAVLAAGYADADTGKTYQCDPVARGNWMAMFLATQLPSAGDITIISADNSTITLAPADLQMLFVGRIMPWVQAVIHTGRAAKDVVLAASAEAEVTSATAAIVWPA